MEVLASAIPGLPGKWGLLPGLPLGQPGGVQASPEVSTVRRGLLRSMKIPIEDQAMAAPKPT